MSKVTARRFPIRRFGLITVAAVVALGLGACSGGNGSPGAAAYVNGQEITENQVTDAIDQWVRLSGQQLDRADMSQVLAGQVVPAVTALEDAGYEVSGEEIEAFVAFLKEQGAPVQIETSELSPEVQDMLRFQILVSQIQAASDQKASEVMQEAISNVDVRLNPRYGSFAPDGRRIAPALGDVIPTPLETDAVVG